MSILTEHCKERTLHDLLESVMTLPEGVIQHIFTQLIKALEVFYEYAGVHFGGLSPSQLMFT